MGIPPCFFEVVGIFFIQICVLGQEEVSAAECRHLAGKAAHKPVQKVDVMTALFQNVRTGFAGLPAPVLHDIRAVIRFDIFAGVDGDQVTELAAFQHFFDFPVDGRKTQHKTRGKLHAALLMGIKDFLTVFNGGRQRFFGEHVLALTEAFQDPFLVVSVGGEDHDPFHAFRGDRFLIAVADLHIRLVPDFFAHCPFALSLVRVVCCHDLNVSAGVTQQSADHAAASAAATQNRHFHDFVTCHFQFSSKI